LFTLSGENDDDCEEEGDEGEGSDRGKEFVLVEVLEAEEHEEPSKSHCDREGNACIVEIVSRALVVDERMNLPRKTATLFATTAY